MPPKSKVVKSTATKGGTKPAGKHSKQPAKPREPLPIPERTKRLFTALCAQIDGGHLANAVKTCDKSGFFSRVRLIMS
jgi:signal recognition particle subunit SRP72